MTAPALPTAPGTPAVAFEPRILVFSTHNISDPGIDLAGSSHMHYTPGVMVMSMPCTSGIRPAWIAHAIARGFDGVFIASDGDECAYLPDCAERASHIVARAQVLLKDAGQSPQRAEAGRHLLGLRGALHEARPAVRGVARDARTGEDGLSDGLRRPRRRFRHRGHGIGPQARATWATGSSSSRRTPASAGR